MTNFANLSKMTCTCIAMPTKDMLLCLYYLRPTLVEVVIFLNAISLLSMDLAVPFSILVLCIGRDRRRVRLGDIRHQPSSTPYFLEAVYR